MTAVITVIAVVLVFEVCCLVDIARAREVRRLDRPTWALICLVTLPLGGILYLALGRERAPDLRASRPSAEPYGHATL